MRMVFVLLIFAGCILELYGQSSTFSRVYSTNPSKCHERCLCKHGYFVDQQGAIQEASVSKVYYIGCHCTVSRALKELITNQFGSNVARTYSWLVFFGFVGRARAKLRDEADARKIERLHFVSQAEFDTKKEDDTNEQENTAKGERQHPTSSGHSGYLDEEGLQRDQEQENEEMAAGDERTQLSFSGRDGWQASNEDQPKRQQKQQRASTVGATVAEQKQAARGERPVFSTAGNPSRQSLNEEHLGRNHEQQDNVEQEGAAREERTQHAFSGRAGWQYSNGDQLKRQQRHQPASIVGVIAAEQKQTARRERPLSSLAGNAGHQTSDRGSPKPDQLLASQRPPWRWRGWFLVSKDKCQERCRRKHGYFVDPDGVIQDTAVGKIYPPKCQCMVSGALKKLIIDTFGPEEARTYSRMNFFGYTDRARTRLDRIADARKIEQVPFFSLAQLYAFLKKEYLAASA